jgi:hypothetical protein
LAANVTRLNFDLVRSISFSICGDIMVLSGFVVTTLLLVRA